MYTSPAMTFIESLRKIYNNYPRQFWLMITGIVIATGGGGMIWPFTLIYGLQKFANANRRAFSEICLISGG
jgi:hypothetical protein